MQGTILKIEVPVIRPNAISLDVKKKLFLLNCIDDKEGKMRSQFLDAFALSAYEKEIENVLASNYFMDSHLSTMMLKEKEGLKHYMGQLP